LCSEIFLRFAQNDRSANGRKKARFSLVSESAPYKESVNMNAFVTAGLIGIALLTIAIWVEIRERRPALGDGDYRNSGHRR
jgi:hypothetical protein